MLDAENHLLPGATNDSWRTWLMTGAHRSPVDRRRMRGANRGLKRMLIEGMTNGEGRPHAWKDFSGAMIRHAVDEAMRALPPQDKRAVMLAYFGGYSNREIARHFGLTEGVVQRRLRRALAAISEHIQHGTAIGGRALSAVAVWLAGRWANETFHHAVQVAAVATATAIIITHPAPLTAFPPVQSQAAQSSTSAKIVPPLPLPAVPAASAPSAMAAAPPVSAPNVKLTVKLPPLPPLPIHVKPLL